MLKLVSFKPEQIREVLELIGIDSTQRKIGNCETCKMDLRLDNIGSISRGRGRALLFCDSSACFSSEVARKYALEHDQVTEKRE